MKNRKQLLDRPIYKRTVTFHAPIAQQEFTVSVLKEKLKPYFTETKGSLPVKRVKKSSWDRIAERNLRRMFLFKIEG